jgi:hypothetical protein
MGGLLPISWSELKAWNDSAGYHLTAWELETMHMLSQVYSSTANLSRDKHCHPPHAPAKEKISGDAIKAVFSQLKKRKRNV